MKRKALLIILPVVIVAIGIAGFVEEGYPFYHALLSSLRLLKADLDPLPPNILIETARWLGIVFFFGIILSAVAVIYENGMAFARSLQSDSVAVHGDSVYAEMLLNSLGRKGIQSDSRISLKAPVQVILFDDDSKTIEFYQKHAAALKKAKEVHIYLEAGCHAALEAENVYATDLAEVRSIDYWRKHFCMEAETIALVGSGRLAETVLLWGFLTNVFDTDCGNEYIVFGDHAKFRALHGDVGSTIKDFGNDAITFYPDDWFMHVDELKKADRIILCDETMANVNTVHEMKSVGIKNSIHLFAENDSVASLIDNSILTAGTFSKDNIQQMLLMDSIHLAGKLCHAMYMLNEDGNFESIDSDYLKSYILTDTFRTSWKDLDSFTRGSNYASAIHDPVKQMLLLDAGLDVSGMTAEENLEKYDMLKAGDKDRLQEIEHIRWSRYHLLNNWKLPEKTVSGKDAENMLHGSLVPYSELSPDDKARGAYYYQTLALRI